MACGPCATRSEPEPGASASDPGPPLSPARPASGPDKPCVCTKHDARDATRHTFTSAEWRRRSPRPTRSKAGASASETSLAESAAIATCPCGEQPQRSPSRAPHLTDVALWQACGAGKGGTWPRRTTGVGRPARLECGGLPKWSPAPRVPPASRPGRLAERPPTIASKSDVRFSLSDPNELSGQDFLSESEKGPLFRQKQTSDSPGRGRKKRA